jgi:hypothetical protein
LHVGSETGDFLAGAAVLVGLRDGPETCEIIVADVGFPVGFCGGVAVDAGAAKSWNKLLIFTACDADVVHAMTNLTADDPPEGITMFPELESACLLNPSDSHWNVEPLIEAPRASTT